jgi:hypothetical protein
MAELTVPQVDFSPLAQLPQIYQQGRDRAVTQQTLAGLGQGGTIDPIPLIQSGIPSLAQLGLSVKNHQDELARQAARDKVSDSHWSASYALQKRAAERADDPTPANFVRDPNAPGGYRPIGPADPAYLEQVAAAKAKAAAQVPPDGFTRSPDGALAPIPGGPQDPEYQGKVAAAKRGPDATFDDETIGEMAKQARAGDTSVFTNIGRGAQGPENLARLRKEIVRQNKEDGVSGSEQALRNAEFFGVKAGQRTIGTKGANIEMAATEFNQVLPVVQQASAAVSRTNYPDLNKIIQAGQAKTGDANVVKLGGGVNTLINLYARAISPTGSPTVSDKDHAREILSAAWSQGQFDAAVGMMQQEIKAALASPEKVRDEMRSRFLKGQGAAPVGYPAPGDTSSAPKSIKVDGYTITEH